MEQTLVLVGFTSAVLALLALDLGVFHRHAASPSFREALAWGRPTSLRLDTMIGMPKTGRS